MQQLGTGGTSQGPTAKAAGRLYTERYPTPRLAGSLSGAC